MEIDESYLKSILQAFELSVGPDTNILEIKKKGFPLDDKRFQFHMEILANRNLIQRVDGKSDIGIIRTRGRSEWYCVPLKITSEGHKYLNV